MTARACVGQLGHPGQAGARNGLVARDHQAHQLGLVVQHLEHRHRDHRRAVGVGDDALRAVARLGEVDFGDDQRHLVVLAPGRRVVDHRHPGRGEPRCLDPRHRRARGEHRDVQTGRVGGLGVFDFDFLAAERQLAPLRTGRREKPHAGRREVALVEQPAHHLAHLAGGTHNTYGNHLTSCPRIHRGLLSTAEAECFV